MIVQVKVKEGDRQRLQAFEGVVIAKRNRGLNSAFTVRKISNGVGVERTFQTYSPIVDSLSVKRRGDVRKAVVLPPRPVRQGRAHQGKTGLIRFFSEKSSPRAAFSCLAFAFPAALPTAHGSA